MSTPEGYDAATGHMDFSLALREMRKGKKVRRAGWLKSQAISLDGEIFFWWLAGHSQGMEEIDSSMVLATDWEEVL